jgi:hypothetical protein
MNGMYIEVIDLTISAGKTNQRMEQPEVYQRFDQVFMGSKHPLLTSYTYSEPYYVSRSGKQNNWQVKPMCQEWPINCYKALETACKNLPVMIP